MLVSSKTFMYVLTFTYNLTKLHALIHKCIFSQLGISVPYHVRYDSRLLQLVTVSAGCFSCFKHMWVNVELVFLYV